MGRFLDLTGQRFGRLTVIERAENKGERVMWLCQCDCGNKTVTKGRNLRDGCTKSCGCYHKEAITKHGKAQTRIYRTWQNIKDRCHNCNNKSYKDYGGRGITVCSEWENDFGNFYEWAMTHEYSDELSIDRIDVNKDYNPDNCRWATPKTQQNNKRNNRLVTLNGETHTVAQWSEITGIPYQTIKSRLYRGSSAERALRVK